MKTIDWDDKNAIVCKHENMWGVYVSGYDTYEDHHYGKEICNFIDRELIRLYPKNYQHYHTAILCKNLILADTEDEARELYSIFEDDMVESSFVYAALYSPLNGGLTENT